MLKQSLLVNLYISLIFSILRKKSINEETKFVCDYNQSTPCLYGGS